MIVVAAAPPPPAPEPLVATARTILTATQKTALVATARAAGTTQAAVLRGLVDEHLL